MALSLTSSAGAENAEAQQANETNPQKHKAALEGEAGRTTKGDSQLKEVQLKLDSNSSPTRASDRHRQEAGDEFLQGSQQGPRTTSLRSPQTKSEGSVGGAGTKKQQMVQRIGRLIAADRAGLFKRPPASGGDEQFREQELQIAQDDIVAFPVEPIPYARYVQIYKASAKRYGFAKDWYVLAAVGKVESNHGQNMGPSSAGAMGPMQFLPSTWKEYGVDGNRDGVANIMDPEDAAPAAAAYLRVGGAPGDWYKALYTYNRSSSYVKKVLEVAEAYRLQAGDDEVESYTS